MWVFFFLFFDRVTRDPVGLRFFSVAEVDIEFITLLPLPSEYRVIGVCHTVFNEVLEVEPRTSCILGKHSTNGVTYIAPPQWNSLSELS